MTLEFERRLNRDRSPGQRSTTSTAASALFLVALLRHLLFTVGSFRLAVSGRSKPDAGG